MERSSEKAAPAPNRRFWWLGLCIVIAIAAYSGAWFYLARQLESRSMFFLSELSNRNVEAQCEALEIRGYPFRLGVFCNSVSADDRLNGASLLTGQFRSAAQVYNPNHIVSELDGPVSVMAADGSSADMDWQGLSASTVFGASGLSRASLQTTDFTARLEPAALAEALGLAADSTEVHVRRNDADLDAALRLKAATLNSDAVTLPALDLEGDVTLANRAWMLANGGPGGNPWHDLSASLNRLTAVLAGGAELSASGPFSIDGEGLISAKFDIEIRGRDAWQQVLAGAFPEATDTIVNAMSLLAGIGSAQDSLTLPININRGRIMLGFIPLGTLPPV